MVGGFFRNNSKKGLTNVSFRAAILLSADSKMALVVRSVFQHTELQGGVFMKPKVIKKALKDTIQAMTDCSWFFSARPGKDNTRNRKFPFQKVVSSILAFGSGTLNHEIMDFFGFDPSVGTSSAFIQRRATILPEAFACLFQHFTEKVDEDLRYCGFRLLAVDGSDLQIAANPDDPDSYYPGVNGQKDYSLLHIIKMPTGPLPVLPSMTLPALPNFSAGKTGWIWSIILKKSRITFIGITRYAFKAMKTLLILLQMRLLPGSNRKLARDRSRHIGICFFRCDLF